MDVTNKTNYAVRTDILNSYFHDINAYDLLTPEEERDLFAKMEDVDEKEKIAIRNEIISKNQRFVLAVAKRYANDETLCDLINVGTIGMIEAFDSYDWRQGHRFCTFAVWYIRRAIYAYLTKENLMVRPTNNSRIAPKVKEIENLFFLTEGRRPTANEIIEILDKQYGIKVNDTMDIYGAKIDYINASVGDDDDNVFENSSVFNEKTSVDNEYEASIESEELSYAMSEALKTLTEREATIVKMANGVGYLKSYKDKEIGEALGITSERVRQIRHTATEKLGKAYLKASEA